MLLRGETQKIRTIIPRSPLAPPPRSDALRQISSKAALVNLISMPEYPNRAVYCEINDPRTSVSTRRRSDGVNGESVVIDGIRDINSGIKLGADLVNSSNHTCTTTCPYFTRSFRRVGAISAYNRTIVPSEIHLRVRRDLRHSGPHSC